MSRGGFVFPASELLIKSFFTQIQWLTNLRHRGRYEWGGIGSQYRVDAEYIHLRGISLTRNLTISR